MRTLVALFNLPWVRRILLVVFDLLLISFSLWLSFALRLAQPWPIQLQRCLWLFPASWLIAPLVYAFTGQYRSITRYAGSRALYGLMARNFLVVILLHILDRVLDLTAPPRSSWVLLWFLFTGLTGTVRILLRDLLLSFAAKSNSSRQRNVKKAIIYGAGDTGVQLASSLRLSSTHRLLAFVDDNPDLWGRYINGIKVLPAQYLLNLIQTQQPHQILLAIPSIDRISRRRIIDRLKPSGVQVLQVPSLEEITSGQARIDALRPVSIEELLGRDVAPQCPELLTQTVTGKVVLVTGAGGSIGSELCRQILRLKPQRLLLLDHHEPSLYAIERELRKFETSSFLAPSDLVAVLGSVIDRLMLQNLFNNYGVQVVFHAAAYKHVPIVEQWPLVGLHNNIIGTWNLAQASACSGVETFILISTDKAVRPTNVMGASKRVAELVIQAMAHEHLSLPSADICFAMVRFGNVLGSSGSVVPLFRDQIASGGPITLTHPDIVRYFMTIPEAVNLVLQAASLAQAGDVLLLDMGDPVRIKDLALQMINLSGLRLRDDKNPNGDIEIVCTGLRPGEKLYEELLIDADSYPTSHPLIYRASESYFLPDQLWPQLKLLEDALISLDWDLTRRIIHSLVPEWQSH